MRGAMKVTLMSSSPIRSPGRIAEWKAPTPGQFSGEILASGRPAVLRGIALSWPLVAAAREDPHKAMAMIAANATGAEADVLRADPEELGRFHYSPDGRSMVVQTSEDGRQALELVDLASLGIPSSSASFSFRPWAYV